MISKVLLGASAVLLGGIGVVLNFMPQEIAARIGLAGVPAGALLVQILAGFLLAIAVFNWMSRSLRVGGIYGKPLALANALHFVIAAFALGRAATGPLPTTVTWALFAVALVFALGFVWLVFVGESRDAAKPVEARG